MLAKKATTEKNVIRSSGNIFADLGLPHPDQHKLKAEVVARIGKLIADRRLTQRQAVDKMGIAQPDVSYLLHGQFTGFSLERLLNFVSALGGR